MNLPANTITLIVSLIGVISVANGLLEMKKVLEFVVHDTFFTLNALHVRMFIGFYFFFQAFFYWLALGLQSRPLPKALVWTYLILSVFGGGLLLAGIQAHPHSDPLPWMLFAEPVVWTLLTGALLTITGTICWILILVHMLSRSRGFD